MTANKIVKAPNTLKEWLPLKMHEAPNLVTVLNRVANNFIRQLFLEYAEKCLWAVEKSIQWCMLPERKPDNEDVVNEAEMPVAATTSSEDSKDTVVPESEVVRPLPWVFFLPLLVCLKAAKTSIDVCSYMLHRDTLEPSSIVEFIHIRRNMLKEMKDQIKGNQEEEKIKDEPSDDLTSHTNSNDESQVPEIKVIQATPEKEIAIESKTELELAAVAPSEVPTVLEPSGTSPTEENFESDNESDSSSTLEASLTEKEDTKEDDEDFYSVKSSSTYFSPDSSYSLHSINEEPKAGGLPQIEKDTKKLSIAAAIEDLQSLRVTDEAPLQTPVSSLSSFTSSLKQTENSKKRTSFSSFFQIKRKTT